MTAEEKIKEKLKEYNDRQGLSLYHVNLNKPELQLFSEIMREYTTEQIKKDRERILKQLEPILSEQDLWFLKVEFDQPITLD